MRMSGPLSKYLNSTFSIIIVGTAFVASLSTIILLNDYRKIIPVDLKNAFSFVALFIIPFVLVYIEITASQNRSRGLLEVISSFKVKLITYLASIAILLGYIVLLIVFAYEITVLLQTGIGLFFDFSLNNKLLTFFVIIILFLAYFFGQKYIKRQTKLYLLTLLGLIIVTVGFVLIISNVRLQNSVFVESVKHISQYRVPTYLSIITKTFALLWVIDIVSIRWKSFSSFKSRFYRTSWPIILLMLMLTWVFGYIFSASLSSLYIIFRIDRLIFETIYQSIYGSIVVYLDIIYLLGSLIVVATSLYVVLDTAMINLRKIMNNSATFFIYDNISVSGKKISKNNYSFIIMFCLVLFLFLVTNFDIALSMSAISFLSLTAIAMIPLLLSKSSLNTNRWFRLPIYPIIQIVVLVMAISLPLNLDVMAITITFLWFLLWFTFYLYSLRKHRIKRMITQSVSSLSIDDNMFNVLVIYNSNKNNVKDLLTLASDIARSENGRVVLLGVEKRLPTLNGSDMKKRSKALKSILDGELKSFINENEKNLISTIVVNGETVEEGVQMVVNDYDIDLVLGEFPNKHAEHILEEEESFLDGYITEDVYMVSGHYDVWDRKNILLLTNEFSNLDMIEKTLSRLVNSTSHANVVVWYVRDNSEIDDNALSTIKDTYQVIFNDLKSLHNEINVEFKFLHLREVDSNLKKYFREDNKRSQKNDPKQYPICIFDISDQNIFDDELSLSRRIFEKLVEFNDVTKIITSKQENASVYMLKSFWLNLIKPLPKASNTQKEVVRKRMLKNSRPSVDFYVMITLSSVIATVGLIQNSVAVIIGAMLVAPLMSPILASSLNLVIGDIKHLFISINSTIKGAIIAVMVAFLLAYLIPGRSLTTEILSRTQPSILDLTVAVASGLAAVYAIVKKENAAALPGVAIAAALVPPLAVVGIGLGDGYFNVAFGATLLFLTNLIAITFFGAIMFMALGFNAKNNNDKKTVKKGVQFSVVALLIVTVLLAVSTYKTVKNTFIVDTVKGIVRTELESNDTKIGELNITNGKDVIDINVQVVFLGDEFDENKIKDLKQKLENSSKKNVNLNLNVVKGFVITN